MSTNPNQGRDAPGGDPHDAASKRAALAGQWRTPPMPAYPSGYSQSPAPAASLPPEAPVSSGEAELELPNPASIPDNSEDYAKALQEAYRKGAEAAARMAQKQQQHASCPNFQTDNPPPPPPQALAPAPPAHSSTEEGVYSHHVHPSAAPPHPVHAAIPDPLSSSMPPPPPQPVVQHVGPPPPHHLAQPPPAQPAPTTTYYTPAPPPPQPAPKPGQRSMSMPDMSAYAAQAEEEKRQKRLARNRASARLRRLRKKNLVDAYETEVGILEKTLKQLQAHEWGKDDNHKALLDALGMERGQQAIKPEQRTEIIKEILLQQMEQVELLRESQMEQQLLANVVSTPDDELSRELAEVLQLTEEQKQNIQASSQGLEREIEALETVSASLQALLENEWLLNEGVQNITDQFTSILHKNQLSKFLLWTDSNAESIDQLDHVQVQPLQGAPLFTFGVESTPMDDEEAKA